MNTKTKKELDATMKYLIRESLDSLSQIKADPVNVIWESDIKLNDEEYNEALVYIKNWNKNND